MTTQISGDTGVSAVQDGVVARGDLETNVGRGIPIAVGVVNGAGALVAGIGYGFASASRSSLGIYDVVFSPSRPDNNYAVQVTCDAGTLGLIGTIFGTQSTGVTVQVRIYDAAAAAADNQFSIVVWGN